MVNRASLISFGVGAGDVQWTEAVYLGMVSGWQDLKDATSQLHGDPNKHIVDMASCYWLGQHIQPRGIDSELIIQRDIKALPRTSGPEIQSACLMLKKLHHACQDLK